MLLLLKPEQNFLHFNSPSTTSHGGFPGSSVVKNLPANAGDTGDAGYVPGLERSPGGGNGNLFQYSHLGNPMDGGTELATVNVVTKSQTQLSN